MSVASLWPGWVFVVIGVLALATILATLMIGCGGGPTYTAADQAADVNTVKLAQGCGLLCLSDAGCTTDQAAACFDAIACNRGSSLHRHGGPELVPLDAGCR